MTLESTVTSRDFPADGVSRDFEFSFKAWEKKKPFTFIFGIDVCIRKRYLYNSKLYMTKADMLPRIWNPDTSGLWQWEYAR